MEGISIIVRIKGYFVIFLHMPQELVIILQPIGVTTTLRHLSILRRRVDTHRQVILLLLYTRHLHVRHQVDTLQWPVILVRIIQVLFFSLIIKNNSCDK